MGISKMTIRCFLKIGVAGGMVLAFASGALAQTSAPAAAPSREDIIRDLTPAPAAPAAGMQTRGMHTRGVKDRRGLGRADDRPPSSEMRDTPDSTYFEFNSAQLTSFGLKVVDEYVKALKDPQLNAFSFRVVGHTDGVGSDQYNDELSRKRAQTVRNYMVAHGVDPMKLDITGMGKRELKNRDNPASAENRRVVIVNLGRQ